MDKHRVRRLAGLTTEFTDQVKELHTSKTKFEAARKKLALDEINDLHEKWVSLEEFLDDFDSARLMKSMGKEVDKSLTNLQETLYELKSVTKFPEEPTSGNENASLLTASFTSITTLLNKITNDPAATIGICPLRFCYANTVELNIRALKGDAESIARKIEDLDIFELIETVKAQFYELENLILIKLPKVNHIDLRSPIERALAGEDPEKLNDGIVRNKDDISEYINRICEGMSGLQMTAEDACRKKVDAFKSTVEDIKKFEVRVDAAFEPPFWTALCFNMMCSYPAVKDQIDDGLQKSQKVLESTADLSVLNSIRERVISFPIKNVTDVHKKFSVVLVENFSSILKTASAVGELKSNTIRLKGHSTFDIHRTMNDLFAKIVKLVECVESMPIPPLRHAVEKCEEVIKSEDSEEVLPEAVDALRVARKPLDGNIIKEILDSIYQTTDCIEGFSQDVNRIREMSLMALEHLEADQEEDEFSALRGALAFLSTSGDVIVQLNDVCTCCTEIATKGEGLKSVIRDIDEVLGSLCGSSSAAGGGILANLANLFG